jgi:serine/threonine protein kinase
MGVVYRALQTQPIRRTVAIKLIRHGIDTSDALLRFNAERQALALMNHPNVASVFDAGVTDDDRPYFVMEYVHGQPITTYCDELRMPLRQRLELFLQVCEAVHHAHQKAVIHRDLKPSNILVAAGGGKAAVKVIDFGVAKVLDRQILEQALVTEFGGLVGTRERRIGYRHP